MTASHATASAAPLAASPVKVQIVADSDFVIQLTPTPLTELHNSALPQTRQVIEFHVLRDVLAAHSAFLSEMFRLHPTLPYITFENNQTSHVLETWLYAIHHGIDTVTPKLKFSNNDSIWVAMTVGEQLGFAPDNFDKIKACFLHRYDFCLADSGLTPMLAQSLSLPCFVFGHAEGFMKLTKYLAYNISDDIFTRYPVGFSSRIVDPQLLDRPLFEARAHIQSKLEKELRHPLGILHSATCFCRKETAFDYEEALMKTGCWPFGKALRRFTVADMLVKLSQFNFTPKAKTCESGACKQNFKRAVNSAIVNVKGDFDGLCLNCMNRSKPIIDGSNDEYIEKNTPYKGCWDMDCRFGHGKITWYYSWLGHFSTRRQIVQKQSNRKPQGGPGHSMTHLPGGSGKPGASRQVGRNNANTSQLPDMPAQGLTLQSTEAGGKENMSRGVYEAEDTDEEFYDAQDKDDNVVGTGEFVGKNMG